MNEILPIKGYALGWFWLNKVPLEDWTWLIEIFATMTDNTDIYGYAKFNDEDIANQQSPARVESMDTKPNSLLHNPTHNPILLTHPQQNK